LCVVWSVPRRTLAALKEQPHVAHEINVVYFWKEIDGNCNSFPLKAPPTERERERERERKREREIIATIYSILADC
jgi:hypothetical protein